ncbi:MAG: ABC transporter permease, partial [Acetanaerobacterium sp.]
VCGKDEAQSLLENGSVAGIMTLREDGGIDVAVKGSGIRQSIIKSFADTFLQMGSAYQTVAVQNPMAMQQLMQEESGEAEYLREIPLGASNPDNTVVYYFALIAMACLYGSFLGMDTVTAVQANQSDIAARTTLAPIHKLKVFGASLSASLVLHFTSILVLIAYLRLVIGVQFGDRLGYVVLACMAGSVMGVAFGAMISALLKRREGTKIAVLICISMVCSFLAGLMYHDMKYVVEKNVPLLGYLNPANLVADAFYALFYYDTLNRYFLNIGLLFGFAGVFFLVVYFVMRRQKYASL